MKRKLPDKNYKVTIRVRGLVPFKERDFDDRKDNPVGRYKYKVSAPSADAAEVKALDKFHTTVPIAVLEHFDIEATVERVP